ncbi:MAG: transglutaminase family protein [Acidobacteriota bacterium]|nr:transglutaminase family protein [Acidobacteriota bacterium]
MKLQATHTTRYLYSDVVSTCHSEAHLTPRACPGQTVLNHRLSIDPEPDFSADRDDYFGNPVTMFSISQPHRELTITSRCTVDLTPAGTPELQLSPPWEEVRERARTRVLGDDFEAAQFVFESPLVTLGKSFAAYAAPSFETGRPLLDAANDLSRRIYEEFQYDKRATTISTPIDEVLETRHGVCQDFAHLMIACLRSLELPVRYISGYLRNDANLTGAEASHAWVSVWCPVLGWQGFDPTNNTLPGARHVTLAWGRDYSDVTPVKGVALGGGEHVISVSVDVSPLSER